MNYLFNTITARSKEQEKGQILLIVVMLVAIVITIVTSVALKSTTETKITKLEEESQKTLSAAEAGIEAALNQFADQATGTVQINTIPNLDNNQFSGTAVISTNNTKTEFSTPVILKDQEYTFYLAAYPGLTTNYYAGTVQLYFNSESGTDCSSRNLPALEVSIIYGSNSQKKYIIEPCSSGSYIHANAGTTMGASAISALSVDGNTFTRQAQSTITIPAAPKVMIVKALYAATRIGFKTNGSSVYFNPQGKYVQSTARSTGGVEKTVQLFQSYPQIPSEFFVTGF